MPRPDRESESLSPDSASSQPDQLPSCSSLTRDLDQAPLWGSSCDKDFVIPNIEGEKPNREKGMFQVEISLKNSVKRKSAPRDFNSAQKSGKIPIPTN